MEIDVGGETFTVYADEDTADAYLAGSFHAGNWTIPTTSDTQRKALVTATRILDRQSWLPSYNTFAARAVETNIINASIELALSLVDGSTVQSAAATADEVSRLKAGSVEIEFRGNGTATVEMRFPMIVQELLRGYLGAELSGLYGVANGVDGKTIFPLNLGFSGGI